MKFHEYIQKWGQSLAPVRKSIQVNDAGNYYNDEFSFSQLKSFPSLRPKTKKKRQKKQNSPKKTSQCSNKFYSLASIRCAACAELIALFCNGTTETNEREKYDINFSIT